MSILPSHKLTIGELFVSMAVGLILSLLPNDIRNQTDSIFFSESIVCFAALAITAVFLFIIKRYEAVGAALLTNSVITAAAFAFGIVNGIITKGGSYWPEVTEYQLVTMVLLWTVPFVLVVVMRMFLKEPKDNNDKRQSFTRFLSLSLRAMMILYIMLLIFRHIIPHAPDMTASRNIYYVPLFRIRECLNNAGEWGIRYLLWNGLLLAPLSFSLLIVNPKIRWWQIMFISFAAGLALEVFQFSLNTGTVYIDDLLLYLLGGLIGVWMKKLIDYIRSVFTAGQDRTMLSLDYTPLTELSDSSDENENEETTASSQETSAQQGEVKTSQRNDLTSTFAENADEPDITLENPGTPLTSQEKDL